MSETVHIVVHSGSFHPDDVFAVAVVTLSLEREQKGYEVTRSRELEVIANADIVLDVGGVYDEKKNRFDHHQVGGAGGRANGIPYAAFGLVWKKYGVVLAGSVAAAEIVDTRLVSPIDYGDNLGTQLNELASGVFPYTFDRIITIFNDAYTERERDRDAVFLELVAFAKKIIEREVIRAQALLVAQNSVERLYAESPDKRLIVLDSEYPWYPILSKHPEPLFVVFPDEKSGNWGISAVRKGEYDFENRKDLPGAWAGKRNSELTEVSGVPDAIFCHNRLFFAVARTRESAIALAQKALSV